MSYPWSSDDYLTHTALNAEFAAVLAAIAAAEARLDDLESEDWIDYTGVGEFALTSSGTQPSLGDSTVTARYKERAGSILYQFDVTIGSTFTAGTGNYRIKLPVASGDFLAVGSGLIVDVSGPTFFPSIVIPIGGNLGNAEMYRAVSGSPTGAPFGAGSFTLAAGDIFRGQLEYKP